MPDLWRSYQIVIAMVAMAPWVSEGGAGGLAKFSAWPAGRPAAAAVKLQDWRAIRRDAEALRCFR